MAERKVVPFDEFYYQLKLTHLFQKHPVLLPKFLQQENDDVWEHDREYIDVWGRDLGMERIRRGRESARKIFERGARTEKRQVT
jgi:hypothetical protein